MIVEKDTVVSDLCTNVNKSEAKPVQGDCVEQHAGVSETTVKTSKRRLAFQKGQKHQWTVVRDLRIVGYRWT